MTAIRTTIEETISEIMDPANAQSFSLKIADLTVRVTCDGSISNLGVEDAKKKFIVHEGPADVRIRAATRKLTEVSDHALLFDSGPVWKLYQSNGSYIFRFSAPAFGSSPYKIAIFTSDFSMGEVLIHPDMVKPGLPADPLWGPLDELLYGNLLSRGRGVEVHACGLVDAEGRGCLFIGASGAGKTTMAGLWQDIPGVIILSDDRIILRRKDGRIRMYGTPWHGEGGQSFAGSAPLARVYFLKKAAQNGLLPLRDVDTVSRLFSCSFLPFYDRDAVDFTLGFLEEIAREVPCFELSVLPDQHVIDFIMRGLPVQMAHSCALAGLEA